METKDGIHCPKCGSNQFLAGKKGFSGTKAVGGALLTGGIGLLAGTIGSNKIIITCLNCGNKYKPGDANKITTSKNASGQKFKNVQTPEEKKKMGVFLMCVFAPLSVLCFYNEWTVVGCIMALFVFIGLLNSLSKPIT